MRNMGARGREGVKLGCHLSVSTSPTLYNIQYLSDTVTPYSTVHNTLLSLSLADWLYYFPISRHPHDVVVFIHSASDMGLMTHFPLLNIF